MEQIFKMLSEDLNVTLPRDLSPGSQYGHRPENAPITSVDVKKSINNCICKTIIMDRRTNITPKNFKKQYNII